MTIIRKSDCRTSFLVLWEAVDRGVIQEKLRKYTINAYYRSPKHCDANCGTRWYELLSVQTAIACQRGGARRPRRRRTSSKRTNAVYCVLAFVRSITHAAQSVACTTLWSRPALRYGPCRIAILNTAIVPTQISLVCHSTRPACRTVVAPRCPTRWDATAPSYGRALSRPTLWIALDFRPSSRSGALRSPLGFRGALLISGSPEQPDPASDPDMEVKFNPSKERTKRPAAIHLSQNSDSDLEWSNNSDEYSDFTPVQCWKTPRVRPEAAPYLAQATNKYSYFRVLSKKAKKAPRSAAAAPAKATSLFYQGSMSWRKTSQPSAASQLETGKKTQ
ncbi:hypothetical protein EVAR_60044_1 [Eumeta japonica]|uniref:Uncharacterized protein n=1 Tax=Eumeta variegata TaxID=151549 RepID=A0A4C1YZV2_EUMVA|nr:hypothetical protein EVAR_60044_1 [Eumeta japonica]